MIELFLSNSTLPLAFILLEFASPSILSAIIFIGKELGSVFELLCDLILFLAIARLLELKKIRIDKRISVL